MAEVPTIGARNSIRHTASDRRQPFPGNSDVISSPRFTVQENDNLVFPKFNSFCKWINGWEPGEDDDPSKHNSFSIRDITKAVWPLYLPLQIFGLFSDRANKLARAWYGACWSIVYSCYRPFKTNMKKLKDGNEHAPVSSFMEKADYLNEGFRALMGSAVSAVYGGGAFGMLWGALTGNDDFFDKSAEVYKTGMFNQNQIFASMNAAIVARRTFNQSQLKEVDREKGNIKANVELIDTLLFIPNIITRGLDTLKLLGLNLMSEGLERVTNALGYFSYGTWATRFGIMKTSSKEGGDLKTLNELKDQHPVLYNVQNNGGKAFCCTLPLLSWIAAGAELFGMREFAEKTFKFEGILERLNPTIASWCMTDPWLQSYLKTIDLTQTTSKSLSEA